MPWTGLSGGDHRRRRVVDMGTAFGARVDTRRMATRSMGWIGAGDGNRTHDIQLGKLTFYL